MVVSWTFNFKILEVSEDGQVKFSTESENNLGELITEKEIRAIAAVLSKTASRFINTIETDRGKLPPMSNGGMATN